MSNQNLPIVAIAALNNNDIENFLVAATPGGIEAQEARGQQTFVNSATLPKQFNFCERKELEQMGVKFGEDVDDLFVKVELPEGWRKVPTDHSMWSKLLDDKDRERASIFYKAAFYDRKAHIFLKRFHSIEFDCLNDEREKVKWNDHTQRQYFVRTANGEVLFSSETLGKDDYESDEKAGKDCRKWLDENRPEWNDVTTYWNETAATRAA